MKNKRGITLVALIITIIVLLILAGVVISMTVGNDGIITKAQGAVDAYKNAQEQEEAMLNQAWDYLNGYDAVSGESLSGGNGENAESVIINEFKIKKLEQSGISLKIDLDGGITTTDSSEVVGYIIVVNNKAKNVTENMPYTIENLEVNSNIAVSVYAIDEDKKLKKSTNNITITTPNYIQTTVGYNNMQYVAELNSSGDYNTSYAPSTLFDGNSNYWHSDNTFPAWFSIKFSYGTIIKGFSFGTAGNNGYPMSSFELQASNTGNNNDWITIQSFTNNGSAQNYTVTYNYNNNTYRYYRFYCSFDNYATLSELTLNAEVYF